MRGSASRKYLNQFPARYRGGGEEPLTILNTNIAVCSIGIVLHPITAVHGSIYTALEQMADSLRWKLPKTSAVRRFPHFG
jgi:hypothetical protein